MEYKITGKINEKVIEEILKVKEKKGLTAEAIIEQAKNKTSSLHNLFDWDNTMAAEKWRLQQARVLINEVKVIVEDQIYYAFENVSVAVNETDATKREYYSRQEIIETESLRAKVVESAYHQLLYWREKYRQYNEFGNIIKEIDAFESKRQKAKAVA